jgi:GntR family transcriptional repressor for pyruvate dehydrogenase complex
MKFNFSPLEIPSEERKTEHQQVAEEITEFLIKKDVSPGHKLPSEQALMDEFGVSRSTIRQALQFLISIGVIVSIPGRGHFVTEQYQIPIKTKKLQQHLLADRAFFQLLEARELIEREIAYLAVKRATKEDIKAMDNALQGIKEAESVDGQIDAAEQVHLQIARATKNNVLVGLMEQLLPKIAQKAKDVNMPLGEDFRQHKLLVDKVKEGNEKELEQAIVDHLEYMRSEFLEELEEETSDKSITSKT